MECLHEKVIQALRAHYSDLQDGLETVEETGRVLGFVVAPAFCRMDHEERQNQLWAYLEKDMTADELHRVGPIVTLTPAEATIDVSLDR